MVGNCRFGALSPENENFSNNPAQAGYPLSLRQVFPVVALNFPVMRKEFPVSSKNSLFHFLGNSPAKPLN